MECRTIDWPERLRATLAGTSEALPRPMSSLELPATLERLLEKRLLQNLRPAAVLVPVLRRPAGPAILLTRRSEQLRSHQGQVSFPGGRADEGDATLAATALREAEEEVGLPGAAVELLGYLDDYPTLTGYRVTPVVGWIDAPPVRWQPSAAEVAEVFELPLARALDLTAYRQQSLLNEGVRLPFYELQEGPHRIWGATAGMLHALARWVHEGR